MTHRFTVLLIALASIAAAIPAAGADVTSLIVNSPAGDYIGQGQSYTLTPDDGSFHMERNFQEMNGVSLFFHRGDLIYTQWWQIDFGGPDRATLTVGQYPDAGRLGFPPTNRPGLQACTDGRCCGNLIGSFEIKHLVYDEAGEVVSFWATAEQRCEGTMPALKLEIMYHLDQNVPIQKITMGQLKTMYR